MSNLWGNENIENDYIRPNPILEALNRRTLSSTGLYDFKIKHLKFMKTRECGYNDMVVRPYVCEYDQGKKNQIVDELLRKGHLGKASESTAGVISMSSAPSFGASIIDGWRAPRFSFDLRVHCIRKELNSIQHELYISGYTSGATLSDLVYRDLGGNLKFNHNLILYINNVQKVTLSKRMNNYTIDEITSLGMNNPILTSNSAVTMRPSDIVSGIRAIEYVDTYNANKGFLDIEGSPNSNTFNRDYTTGNSFINSIINNVNKGYMDAYTGDGLYNSNVVRTTNEMFNRNSQNSKSILGNISYDLKDKDIVTEPFFMAASNYLSLNSDNVLNTLNIDVLKRLDADFSESIIEIADVIEDATMLNTFNTETFAGIDKSSAKVQEVGAAVSKWLANSNIVTMELRVTNMRTPDEPLFSRLKPKFATIKPPTFINNLLGLNIDQVARSIQVSISAMVEYEIDPIISYNGELEYDMIISMDLLNDHTIALKYANQPEHIVYRIPAFADMLFNPMLGVKHDKDSLVAGISGITDEIKKVHEYIPTSNKINL